ncbi:hypothetical protein BCR33DRAFT_724147 [Rhizoclosmatium globosum]|uniref:Uncharacterized protein n=1 Tax=Rhizoclosmatium globosum TaxID=329046 RepID=A0A1Y2B8U9_9FUNG|nr:hypothetical protein BCR33DRAFT_724147 [Rhizoclosmatium globosum]|eukprot:ORY30917.1 hypothetical protein BCR33DRAFT_724147 [Rhizoclosmatium globosum]
MSVPRHMRLNYSGTYSTVILLYPIRPAQRDEVLLIVLFSHTTLIPNLAGVPHRSIHS